MTRITSVLDRYDLLTRERQDVLEFCADHGILFLPWFPPLNGMRAQPSSVLGRIASAHGATPGQVALAWMLRTASVTVPLPGTWNPAWEDENLAAIDLDLTAEEVRELSDLPGIGAGV